LKKLLLIGLRYHDYTAAIIDEISRQGYQVTYHEIQPRTLYLKALKVLSEAAWQSRIDAHHRDILERERGNRHDYVLFIQAHQFSEANLRALREQQRQAHFVLYNWDAVTTHDYRPHVKSFDRAYTFDPDDARELGIGYLPLFCMRAFQDLRQLDQHERGVYFVGNIVSVQRYEALVAFKRYCADQGIRLRSYMACTPRVYMRLLRAGYLATDVSLRSIAQHEFIDMIERSTTVFDFANHRQAGYTMRVVENLCAGKKIITSNPRVRDEPFYTEDRFLVFEGLDFSAVRDFVARDLDDPGRRFEQFHVQAFVRALLDRPA
jgi:hypothetical protein